MSLLTLEAAAGGNAISPLTPKPKAVTFGVADHSDARLG